MAVTWSRTRAIGLTEMRRRWRAIRARPTQFVSFILSLLFIPPLVIGPPLGAYVGGQALLSGSFETPIADARRLSVSLWLAVAVFGGYRGYTTLFGPDNRDGLLTTVSYHQLLVGVLFAEGVTFGLPAFLVSTVAAILFAVSVDSLIAGPTLLVAIGLLLSTAFATGLVVALLIKNGGVRSRALNRLRTVAFVVCFGLYMSVIFSNSASAILDPLYWLLTPTPIGWVGDLVLLSAGVGSSPLAAGGALLVGTVGVGLSVPVVSRLTEWLWYADGLDPVSVESTTDVSWLLGLLPQPLVGVAMVDWKRTWRAPVSIAYVIYPHVILFVPIIETVETGTVGRLFPLLVVVCGIWLTGALFTLNSLGNEGAVLPSTLLTPTPGRAVVGGHIVAGALIGLPVTATGVVVFGLLSPLTGWAVLSLTVGTLFLAAAAGPIATGIGVALPRYEAVSLSRSRKAIIPSTFAFVVYSTVIGVSSFPLLASHSRLGGQFVSSMFGVRPVVTVLAGIGVSTALAAAFCLASVLFAVRRIDRFQFD